MFLDFAFSTRQIKASEYVLDALYKKAYLGLKGDKLALAAQLRPEEFRQLRAHDANVDLVILKAQADAEARCATMLMTAAEEGDTAAALEILKHSHGWTARQEINMNITQDISITQALQAADLRIYQSHAVIEHEPQKVLTHDADNQIQRRTRAAAHDAHVGATVKE